MCVHPLIIQPDTCMASLGLGCSGSWVDIHLASISRLLPSKWQPMFLWGTSHLWLPWTRLELQGRALLGLSQCRKPRRPCSPRLSSARGGQSAAVLGRSVFCGMWLCVCGFRWGGTKPPFLLLAAAAHCGGSTPEDEPELGKIENE